MPNWEKRDATFSFSNMGKRRRGRRKGRRVGRGDSLDTDNIDISEWRDEETGSGVF